MIIQPETILSQLLNHLSHESRGCSVTNSDDSEYWALKTAVEAKQYAQQSLFGLASFFRCPIMTLKSIPLISRQQYNPHRFKYLGF